MAFDKNTNNLESSKSPYHWRERVLDKSKQMSIIVATTTSSVGISVSEPHDDLRERRERSARERMNQMNKAWVVKGCWVKNPPRM
jgi:hypothetical protein